MIRGATAQGWSPRRPIAETEPQISAQDHSALDTESLCSKRRGRTLPVTAASSIRPWLASGWESRDRRLSRSWGDHCWQRAPGRDGHPFLPGFRAQSIGTRRSQIQFQTMPLWSVLRKTRGIQGSGIGVLILPTRNCFFQGQALLRSADAKSKPRQVTDVQCLLLGSTKRKCRFRLSCCRFPEGSSVLMGGSDER